MNTDLYFNSVGVTLFVLLHVFFVIFPYGVYVQGERLHQQVTESVLYVCLFISPLRGSGSVLQFFSTIMSTLRV